MSVCSDVNDYVWLMGSEAAVLLQELAASTAPLHTSLQRLRKSFSTTRSHLLVEQVELRRRAAAKFTQSERMFFTRTALEQATDEWIARYKASRFASPRTGLLGTRRGDASPPPTSVPPSAQPLIADLCCGIGGDLIAFAVHRPVVAVDRDPVVAHFARKNCDICVGNHSAESVGVLNVNVEDFDLSAVDAWHIDPDRRTTGRRTTSLEHFTPDLDTIERLLRRAPNVAIKLAPATRVPAAWESRFELEWISRGGECRQLVAWHGELAWAAGRRRATVVAPTASAATNTCSFTGEPNVPLPIAERPNQFVFDIDPAVLAAGLKGAVAAKHNLTALSSGPTYLTGRSATANPMLSCFHVEEMLPMRVRSIASYLRERGIGPLEIKKRGVDIEPEKLRRELKLRGDAEATLLITPIAGRPTAILARRVSSC